MKNYLCSHLSLSKSFRSSLSFTNISSNYKFLCGVIVEQTKKFNLMRHSNAP